MCGKRAVIPGSLGRNNHHARTGKRFLIIGVHPDDPDIRFGKKNAIGNALFPLSPTLFGSMDWSRFQFEFTVPEGVGEEKSPYIGFYLPKEAEGKVWIDHVEIVPL